MPMKEHELIEAYGVSATTRNAALFVGAGLSRAAGYPTWNELLDAPRAAAGIPPTLSDLPLVAEYCVQAVPGGRDQLDMHILSELVRIEPKPGPGHDQISLLPVSEVWTTNYDPLLEIAMPSALVVRKDDDLRDRRRLWDRRILKMHGSLAIGPPVTWEAPPVITRGDYERYEIEHPRLWAALTATFVTRSFLFLGFSFSDPNIQVLLRLARTHLGIGSPEHYAVLRQPNEPSDRALYSHQVRDLEKSGIGVYEIDDYQELVPFLRRLVRRTRLPRLFVAGSDPAGRSIKGICGILGHALARTEAEVASLGGPAGMELSYAFGRALRAQGHYRPERVRLYFRRKAEAPPALRERTGMVLYTDDTMEVMRRNVLTECRAALVIGGQKNTAAEVEVATELGVPVIPLAHSGGAAFDTWQRLLPGYSSLNMGGRPVSQADFQQLGDPDPQLAAAAAVRFVEQAMHLEPKCVAEAR